MTEQELIKMSEREVNFPFISFRPGGNDTALFIGIPQDQTTRASVNDEIMGAYPNIEQVGFVNLDPTNPELMMAGGEFCGNATRSTAWHVLRGLPGDIEIKVSGVQGRLRAGVTDDGEAYAQMPIYNDPSMIVSDLENPGNYTVQMEGITHYIDFNTSKIDGLTNEEIKKMAMEELRRRGLDEGPAAGIIYAEEKGDCWSITPIVYVKAINTEFLETGCGSGTTALGMVLALEEGGSVKDVPVYQPSGLPIKISVDYDADKFSYAQIQGPVQKLVEGSLEKSRGNAFSVEQIATEADLRKALEERGLRLAYKDAFGRPPYNESFTDEEIDEMFSDYFRDGHVFIAIDNGEIIAFSATQPLTSVPDIGELLAYAPGVTYESWYIPELGIKEKYEGKGIAKNLMKRALDAIPADVVTLRTNVDNTRSQGLYMSLGFNVIEGLYQEIEQARVEGDDLVDRRLFMSYERPNFK